MRDNSVLQMPLHSCSNLPTLLLCSAGPCSAVGEAPPRQSREDASFHILNPQVAESFFWKLYYSTKSISWDNYFLVAFSMHWLCFLIKGETSYFPEFNVFRKDLKAIKKTKMFFPLVWEADILYLGPSGCNLWLIHHSGPQSPLLCQVLLLCNIVTGKAPLNINFYGRSSCSEHLIMIFICISVYWISLTLRIDIIITILMMTCHWLIEDVLLLFCLFFEILI